MSLPNERFHPHFELHRWYRWIATLYVWRFLPGVMKFATFLQFLLSAIALPILGALGPESEWPGIKKEALLGLYNHRFQITVWLLGIGLLLQAIRWIARKLRAPYEPAKIQALLDHAVNSLFGGIGSVSQDKQKHQYRATLFKAVKLWFAKGKGCLIAVARSGYLYKRMLTIFSIDSENEQNNTGIAGECWFRWGEVVKVDGLPDQHKANVTQAEQQEYKRRSFLADEEYDAMTIKSRTFLAFGIKDKKGEMWGVLVLDSTDENIAPSDRQAKAVQAIFNGVAVGIQQLIS